VSAPNPWCRGKMQSEACPFSRLVETWRLVVDQLSEDDAFAFAATCWDARSATCLANSPGARFPLGVKTSVIGAWASVARLQWSLNMGYRWSHPHLGRAARHGCLEALQWARVNGALELLSTSSAHTCAMAASGGQIDVLKWLLDVGCRMDENTCSAAAIGGHLDLLRYARARGCPWDSSTCLAAAVGNHLAVLRWVVAERCPWDFHVIDQARMRGHKELELWAAHNGCPQPPRPDS
jgi:hypothetical protein